MIYLSSGKDPWWWYDIVTLSACGIPLQRASNVDFEVFFYVSMNKQTNIRSRGRWFVTVTVKSEAYIKSCDLYSNENNIALSTNALVSTASKLRINHVRVDVLGNFKIYLNFRPIFDIRVADIVRNFYHASTRIPYISLDGVRTSAVIVLADRFLEVAALILN